VLVPLILSLQLGASLLLQLEDGFIDVWKDKADAMQVERGQAQQRQNHEDGLNRGLQEAHTNRMQQLHTQNAQEVDGLHNDFVRILDQCSQKLYNVNTAKKKLARAHNQVANAQHHIAQLNQAVLDAEKALEVGKDDAEKAEVEVQNNPKPASMEADMAAYTSHQAAKQKLEGAERAQDTATKSHGQATQLLSKAHPTLEKHQVAVGTVEAELQRAQNVPSGAVTMLQEAVSCDQHCRYNNLVAERNSFNSLADEAQQFRTSKALQTPLDQEHAAAVAQHSTAVATLKQHFVKVLNLCRRQEWQIDVATKTLKAAEQTKEAAESSLSTASAQLKAAEDEHSTYTAQVTDDKGKLATAKQDVAEAVESANGDQVTAAMAEETRVQQDVVNAESLVANAEVTVQTKQGHVNSKQSDLDAAITGLSNAQNGVGAASEGNCFHGDCSGSATGPPVS